MLSVYPLLPPFYLVSEPFTLKQKSWEQGQLPSKVVKRRQLLTSFSFLVPAFQGLLFEVIKVGDWHHLVEIQ